MKNKRGEITMGKIILLILLLIAIFLLFLIVKNNYKMQKMVGEIECEEKGFTYDKSITSFNNPDTIICDNNKTDEKIKLSYLNGGWKRTEW